MVHVTQEVFSKCYACVYLLKELTHVGKSNEYLQLTELVSPKHKSEPQTHLMDSARFTDICFVQSLEDLDQFFWRKTKTDLRRSSDV